MTQTNHLGLATAGLFGALAALGPSAPAAACGGFFCDQTQPVEQAAERIIFHRGGDGTVTAVIQIRYAGPAEEFAWVLPVAGRPAVGVSSDLAFTRLSNATSPQYILTTTVDGACYVDPPPSLQDGGFAAADASAGPSGPDPGEVTVVDSGAVGPYDYVILSLTPGAPEPASVAVEWLRENGYQIDPSGAARLAPYLEGGMNLLAFRLTKGTDAGSIRPVVLGFGAGLATIPIRPTAVAAVADMPMIVWVLGPHRAIPVNYRALELNEALIDWLDPTTTYDAVVTEAANQAGGQGFVTEMSGPAGELSTVVFSDGEEARWASLTDRATWEAPWWRVTDAIGDFRRYDGMGDVIAATVPLPDGVDADQLEACPWCFSEPEGFADAFDVDAFLAAMEALVIEPMRVTRRLFDTSSVVTRFYTTMSADEMTRDPSFAFNPDLAPIDRTRRARRVIECSPDVRLPDAPWRVVLSNGLVVRGRGNRWPYRAGAGMPANARILRYGTEGQGDVLIDNSAAIAAALPHRDERLASPPSTPPPGSGGLMEAMGCHAAPGGSGGAWALALLAFAALGRRSRGRG
ncbi:MAG: DUF2330 domain-containing protein [Sandaracinaceae bacterium]|nr:DUF2330 domain-containing protein [Sandaracinaceae bacterium]